MSLYSNENKVFSEDVEPQRLSSRASLFKQTVKCSSHNYESYYPLQRMVINITQWAAITNTIHKTTL